MSVPQIANNRCGDLDKATTADFTLVSTGKTSSGMPPQVMNRTDAIAACTASNWPEPLWKFPDVKSWFLTDVDDISTAEVYAAYIAGPSITADGTANCTTLGLYSTTVTVDSEGKYHREPLPPPRGALRRSRTPNRCLRSITEATLFVHDAERWHNWNEFCASGTPLPLPDASPSGDVTEFINRYMDLYFAGMCSDVEPLLADNYTIVQNGAAPVDRANDLQQCSQYAGQAQVSAAVRSTRAAGLDGNTALTTYIMSSTIRDSTTDKQCTIFCECATFGLTCASVLTRRDLARQLSIHTPATRSLTLRRTAA